MRSIIRSGLKNVLQAILASSISASPAMAQSASAPKAGAAPLITLTRLDCGTIRANNAASFSDTFAFDGKVMELPVSCYLIRHGEDYLLWDAGLNEVTYSKPLNRTDVMSATVTRPLIDQIRALGIDPTKIGRLAVSHYHLDHVGQAGSFPNATLMIGEADWTGLLTGNVPPVADGASLKHWLKDGGKVETIARDKDVFGDGSVMILDAPGHSPGHKFLLVRLAKLGPVLLTGDLFHLKANFDTDGVPAGNASRADTLASIDRFKAIARNLKALIIIGHEPADLAKLPSFPQAAR